ncbi:hypothetical protein [Peribacillus frigoritolerans]|nr:hypothetical protein [Peribacillus frigoritolerans]USK63257.1 hypothetical protein LIT26_18700 [Peribacillus frigoritolerans]
MLFKHDHDSIQRDQLEMITLDQLVSACKMEIKEGYRVYSFIFITVYRK